MRARPLHPLIFGVSLIALLLPASAQAQAPAPAASPAQHADDEEEAIVVTGQRERGSVIGDIQPEQQLRAADVRALGVTNVTELIAELAPQQRGAGSGGQPVVLLEGRRISGFQEVANLPAEAISRVDILPEAVALRYGFPADQKVLNIVLRERFRAITVEADYRFATEGGTASPEGELSLLRLGKGRRIALDAELETRSALLESERGLVTDPATQGDGRALVPWQRTFALNGSYALPLNERTSATLNGSLGSVDTVRQSGLVGGTAILPPGTPYNAGSTSLRVPFTLGTFPPLTADTGRQTARAALTVQREGTPWRWTATAAYDRADSRSIITRGLDLTAWQTAATAGAPDANPALPLAARYVSLRPADDARAASDTARVDATLSGTPARLPAGDVTASFTAIGSLQRLSASAVRSGVFSQSEVARDLGSMQASVDLPLARRSRAVLAALGDLSVNANATLQQLSDVGTLRTLGGGFNWTPVRPLSLVGTFSSSDTAPTANQIGDPFIITPGVVLFDYARGTSVFVNLTGGGNPALRPARRETFRLNGTLRAGGALDVTLTAAFLDETVRNAIIALPAATSDVQAAFPDRFTRDALGSLIAVDARPINLALRERRELRWGISLSKSLKTPQRQINAMRAAFARQFPDGVPPGARPAGQDNAPRERQGAGQQGGFRGFGGMGGGRGGQGGRATLALYHSWNMVDRATLREGLPVIDLLDGGTLGSGSAGGGVQPRHEIELQGGVFMAGVGLRVTGNWQGATRVNTGGGSNSGPLRYAPLARFNLRLFANTGFLATLGVGGRWLRGTRVQLGVDNLFNARPNVADALGATPPALQGAYLDPQGRTIRISLRKMFF